MRVRALLALSVAVQIVWSSVLTGQEVHERTSRLAFAIQRISTDDGLPDATVYDVQRDATGWLYLATAAGLFRYDGVDYLPVPAPEARQREVHNLFVGGDERMYVQNFRRQMFWLDRDTLRVVLDYDKLSHEFLSVAALEKGVVVRSSTDLRFITYAALHASHNHNKQPPGTVLNADGRAYVSVGAVSSAHAALVDREQQFIGLATAEGISPLSPTPGTR